VQNTTASVVAFPETFDRKLFFDNPGSVNPDWRQIVSLITETTPDASRQDASRSASMQWLQYLRQGFGGAFSISVSPNFLILSDVYKEKTESTLNFCERVLDKIENHLGDARWKNKLGPHVIILFSDPELYYSYVSQFYSEGQHAQSGGVFIRRGYAHIALPVSRYGGAHTLVHELTHNCLAHLPIPLWLNEGLARTFERLICGGYGPILDEDVANRHHEFWNEEKVQQFWSGQIFDDGESNDLSYSLAEILIELVAQERRDFAGFLGHATYKDAGAAAAQQYIGKSLGEIAGTFLGPGDWEPKLPDITRPAA
jgi:hypothetical protein